MKRAVGFLLKLLFGVAAALFLIAAAVHYRAEVYRGFGDSKGLWHDPPAMDSVFPQERAAAAYVEAAKYGVKP